MCVVWLLQCRKVPLPFAVSTWFAKLVGFPIVAAARKAQGGLHLEWPSPLLVFVLDGNFVWCGVRFKELDCTPFDSWKFTTRVRVGSTTRVSQALHTRRKGKRGRGVK